MSNDVLRQLCALSHRPTTKPDDRRFYISDRHECTPVVSCGRYTYSYIIKDWCYLVCSC